ncbi:hypothetical protein LR68_01595 [Anoxybacillus sp. BCO1]|nr:hypothetical protein LR68_01595 [Anoxybacillus sp. BCO1]
MARFISLPPCIYFSKRRIQYAQEVDVMSKNNGRNRGQNAPSVNPQGYDATFTPEPKSALENAAKKTKQKIKKRAVCSLLIVLIFRVIPSVKYRHGDSSQFLLRYQSYKHFKFLFVSLFVCRCYFYIIARFYMFIDVHFKYFFTR